MTLCDTMSFQLFALVGFTLLLQSVGVYSVAQQCYFCNTEVHGQGCNDPVAPENIQIQSCASSEIVTASSNLTTESDISVRRVRDTYANVCIYMTYTFDSRNVSSRGCEVEYIDTNIGVLDICAYYVAIRPVRISNFNCNVCISDLCNHAGAESEEVEQPEEELPGIDDEEENPEVEAPEEEEVENDETGGDGADSAHVASVSFTLLVSLALAKFFMV